MVGFSSIPPSFGVQSVGLPGDDPKKQTLYNLNVLYHQSSALAHHYSKDWRQHEEIYRHFDELSVKSSGLYYALEKGEISVDKAQIEFNKLDRSQLFAGNHMEIYIQQSIIDLKDQISYLTPDRSYGLRQLLKELENIQSDWKNGIIGEAGAVSKANDAITKVLKPWEA